MPQKPPTHRPPRIAGALSHSRQVYEREIRKQTPSLALAKRIRSSGHWQAVRRETLKQHPLCADPHRLHAGRPVPAQDVHHKQPIQQRPDLAFHPDNLLPVCRECHAIFSGRERRGK